MPENPSDDQRDDAGDESNVEPEQFVTSEKRPDHANDSPDSGDSLPDTNGSEQADGPASPPEVNRERPDGVAEDAVPASAEPSDSFLDSIDDELREEFEAAAEDGDNDAAPPPMDEDGKPQTTGPTPETEEAHSDGDNGDSDTGTASAEAKSLKRKADQIREENESASADPLEEYENQDLDSLKEVPDAYEYTHRGIRFLLAPPDPDDDSAETTDARDEFQRIQAAIRKRQNDENLTEDDKEAIERMQKLAVQRAVVAPEITDAQWESWPSGTKQALTRATAQYLNDVVSGFRSEQKSGLDPTALR